MVDKTIIHEEKLPFEDLEVWQEAVSFADQCLDVIEKIETDRRHYRLIEQVESACASSALNIAEGKGRFSKKEFIQFLYISRGSLFETVTLLEIFRRRKWISNSDFLSLKEKAIQLGKRINSLISVCP
jgi:four helix bundle protein